MECLDISKCLSDEYIDAPVVASNPEPNSFYGKTGCGALVLAAGTPEEAAAAVVAHRDAVRAEHGQNNEGS